MSSYDAVRAGFGKVVFAIRKDIEPTFKQSIGNRFAGVVPVEVVGDLVDRGVAKVTMLKNTGAWFGATYREDKAMVTNNIQKLVDAGIYPEKLFQ